MIAILTEREFSITIRITYTSGGGHVVCSFKGEWNPSWNFVKKFPRLPPLTVVGGR